MKPRKPPALPQPLTDWLRGRGWDWFAHQLATFEAATAGRDVLLCAPTGAGKTLSGFLPALADLLANPQRTRGLHTLYVSPLKALAVDVHRNIGRPIAEMKLPVTHETRTGDTPSGKRQRQRVRPPDLLMTTPESLSLLISYDDAATTFAGLRFVIVDELHALMGSKRGDLLALALARLRTLAPQARFIGLSATIADPELARDWLCGPHGAIVRAPARVRPDIRILEPDARIPWAGHLARYAMPEIYQALTHSPMSIVFVNTRAQAELVFQTLWQMNERGLRIGLHHGSLEPALRRRVEERMAGGQLDCVVATSSLDLGIDWAEVALVVQVGAPKGVSRLLQRIGRSNHRLNEPSRALLVPTNRFEVLECQAALDAVAHRELDGTAVRTGGLDVLAQHIVGTACASPFDADRLYAEVRTAWPYSELSREDFDQTLRFVADGGYALKSYERYRRLALGEDGRWHLTAPAFARQYRLNVGTIVEAPMLKVKRRRQYLGMIEESFIEHLSHGDTFLFAGQVVQFEGLVDGVVMVSSTTADTARIPSYDGGKLPLSTHLARRVRELLQHPRQWRKLPDDVGAWLELQQQRSQLPGMDDLLVESFKRGNRFYTVAYPFAGRQAHQTLGFLVMRRLKRLDRRPLGFVASDYALVFWSMRRPGDLYELFSVELLGEELPDWLHDTPLLKRTFREVAVISGLVERQHPGHRKTGRQMSFSSDLIFDVLMRYEPQHVLIRAAYQEAMGGLIDVGRLSDVLNRVQGHIIVRELKAVSPLAVPLMLDIARESVARKDAGDWHLEELEHALLAEAGFEEGVPA
ncbi:ligase-associated DNA damage response DEXH box helicase [Ramlibacter sp. AW1]|uniref:Ligase-associated DNA damage response DEXH box helicase n=1 Tax=Ramlibacter aurantiacus TaxID=2801330 RepID=A0A936ZFI6_9BURK|nr:ligase-associated DNA damage response DEXH box helicase [Ramlibacter aurantiacus]MBL0419338.1 ligase-associated DNA damage response DEXH box helicase [Ramlibacter aurantiacus]